MLNYQIIQAFFTNNAYTFELALDIWLFCHYFERKKRFFLRSFTSLLALLGMSILWNSIRIPFADDAWAMVGWNIVKYIAAFALGFWGVIFCFESRLSSALFTMICAFATQHISYRIYASMLAVLGLGYTSVAATFIISFVTLIVYVSLYYAFVRRLKLHPERTIDNKSNIVVGGILILFTIVLHFISEVYLTSHSYPILYILFSAYSLICCIFTLMIEQGLFRNSVLANDKALLEHLLHKQEEQYHVSKANMDIINIKCHDMKHQISRMTRTTDPKAIQELERIINIYDSSLKTGNEILDVCLMEKKLLCEKNNIKFDYIVHGESLSFMQPSDIFSLFGNAMENAIEALCKIDNEEQRIIFLNVKTQLGMIVIHVENYYQGQLDFADGLPRTTKGDECYHGFGVRSIQMVAEKYKGHVAVLTHDNVFNLNISIPIPE